MKLFKSSQLAALSFFLILGSAKAQVPKIQCIDPEIKSLILRSAFTSLENAAWALENASPTKTGVLSDEQYDDFKAVKSDLAALDDFFKDCVFNPENPIGLADEVKLRLRSYLGNAHKIEKDVQWLFNEYYRDSRDPNGSHEEYCFTESDGTRVNKMVSNQGSTVGSHFHDICRKVSWGLPNAPGIIIEGLASAFFLRDYKKPYTATVLTSSESKTVHEKGAELVNLMSIGYNVIP